jgi:hypothetical protein
MKSVRILFQTTVVLPALLLVLWLPLRADDSSDAIRADSLYAQPTITFSTTTSDTPLGQSTLTLTQPAVITSTVPVDSAFEQPTAAPCIFPRHLSVSRLFDEAETGLMNSLPLAALFLFLMGLRQLFLERRGSPDNVIEVELPVVVPPRRIPQRLSIY